MNYVLFHLGRSLPIHLLHCIKQIQFIDPDNKIFILTNLPNRININNVTTIDLQFLKVEDIGSYYINDALSTLWRTSVLRMFYLEEFLKQSNIQNVIHFDNDVVLYKDVTPYLPIFKQFNFLITSHFEKEYVFGFSYIKNAASLTEVNKTLLELVRRGEQRLFEEVDCTGSMPHEMRLLCHINELHNNTLIDLLPVVPSGPGSNNFDLFNVCFDPSSYGKHIGGSHEFSERNCNFVKTTTGLGTEKHHYIGRQLINNKIEVVMENKMPFIIDNNIKYPIINLHIHTKKLEDFICK